MKRNKFYGFRYYSGRRTTWGNSNKIAGEVKIFNNLKSLKTWINDEKISNPCGLSGGERVRVSRKQLIKMIGIKEFNFWIEDFFLEGGMDDFTQNH